MFEALNHEMPGDHLDLTFRDTRLWPRVGPDPALPPSLFISLGDPVAGPDVQLVVMPSPPEAMWLDTHFHATDQFRVVLQGEFQLQRKCMTARDFGYQSPGIPYREGVPGGSTGPMWMLMVHGERRGARSTMTRSDGNILIDAFGEDQLDRPVSTPDDPYWADVIGGAKGRSGLATTIGRQIGGFSWGNFDASDGWHVPAAGLRMTAGLMGCPEKGPLVLTLRAEPDVEILPAFESASEVVIAVIRGTCDIGDRKYDAGEVRVQKARVPLEAMTSGPQGADIIIMFADRRAVIDEIDAPLVRASRTLIADTLAPALQQIG